MMETHEWRRSHVVVRKLPDMRKQLLDLDARLKKLEEQ
jgi:UDP-3-O-[3-hydroxymyristoyl] glucosamine N-acyltransferase